MHIIFILENKRILKGKKAKDKCLGNSTNNIILCNVNEFLNIRVNLKYTSGVLLPNNTLTLIYMNFEFNCETKMSSMISFYIY